MIKSAKILLMFSIILFALNLLVFVLKGNDSNENVVVFVTTIDDIKIGTINEKGKVEQPIVNDEDFLGWYYNDEIFDFNTNIDKNYILYAKYDERKKLEVTFNTSGGTKISSVIVKENEKVHRPNDPIKEGYVFVEWQLNGKKYDFDTLILKNIQLVAVWREFDNSAMVHFDTNGGSEIKSQKVKINSKATIPTTPTKKGYIFTEWQLNGKKYDFSNIITKDITLVASWKEKTKVNLTFDTNGNNTIASRQVYVNENIGTLPTPVKEGFVFARWELNGKSFSSSSMISSNTTIKAVWISVDENNLNVAKNAIASKYNITKSDQKIIVSSKGCTITHNEIGRITRKLKDSNMDLTFSIICGEKNATVTSSGVIKASVYRYSVTPSGNMVNSIVKVNGITSGSLYKNGNNVGDIINGQAIINDVDLVENPILQLKIAGDNTIYEVSKG